MECEICKTTINEPVHVEVSCLLIRHDKAYIGSINFNLQEREDFVSKLIMHKSCWQNLMDVKKDKNKKIKVE